MIKKALGLAAAAVLLGASTMALAQAYPERPIKLIVPYPAGGAIDTMARAVGQRLGEGLGQSIVIENRAGGNATIGTDSVAKSAPDGYTLLFTSAAPIVANPHLYKRLNVNPLKELAPVSLCCIMTQAILVSPELGAKTLKDFVALARARPGALNYASMGSGSSGHLNAESFKKLANIDITHVPYKGSIPAITDVMSGRVSAIIATLGFSESYIRSGKLLAIAVASPLRSPLFPNVPTVAEEGFPNYVASDWMGVFAPIGTPKEIVLKLDAAIRKVLEQPDFKNDWIVKRGMEPSGLGGPADFAKFIQADSARTAQLIKLTGATLD